jgi:hypothetical protein
MHKHGLIERRYDVTIMDTNGNTAQIPVQTPCTCDLQEWVQALPNLPIDPAFVSWQLAIDSMPEGVSSEK